MRQDESKRISVSVGISVAAHAALAILVVVLPSAMPRSDRDDEATEVTIEIEPPPPDEAIPAPPETPTEPDRAPPEPEAREQPPPVAPTSRPERSTQAALVTVPEPAAATEIRPDEETLPPELAPSEPRRDERIDETPAQRRERIARMIDPTRVAASSFTIEGPGPTSPRGPQSAAEAAGSLRPRTEAEVEAELSGHLREQAMTKAHVRRTRLVARPQSDGSYVYAGHAFTARITPEGEVVYEDRPGVQTDGFSTSGSFDLTDAFMRGARQDPYSAERQRFEDDNAELIARLESEAQARRMARGLRTLRGRLARIWQNEMQTPEQRRRLIFEQWAEVDESGGGGGAREAIEGFVRETLPAGSEHAYTAAELRSLNAGRAGGARFDPYR